MNGASGASSTSSPPSPADDPLDRLSRARDELKSVTDDVEDTGQFDVSKSGLQAKGIPKGAMGIIAVAVAIAIVLLAAAYAIHLAQLHR
mgnify:CR=1 FL=1